MQKVSLKNTIGWDINGRKQPVGIVEKTGFGWKLFTKIRFFLFQWIYRDS